jgi:hypothetical protein
VNGIRRGWSAKLRISVRSRNVITVSAPSAAAAPPSLGTVAPTRTLTAARPRTRSAASAPIIAPATCAAAYFSGEPDVSLPNTQNPIVTAEFR